MTQLGRYRVLRPLGRGGMAEVLEAVAVGAEGFERRVAIKRLLPGHEQDERFIGMFLDEARIASRLHHANIVSVLDYGIVDEQPFQVLELVDGLDAAKLWSKGFDRGQLLPMVLVLHLGTTIAHALHHAHSACDAQGEPLGIVHRDVSPANILVSWEGDVLLADFGIAFAKHRSQRTQTGMAKGTITYWAPEQATGGEIDARTDVFALAATIHRLITGRSPLAGENALADLLVGRPLVLDPSLPEDVAEVLARALERDKARRHADAAEFAAALGTCMSQRLQEDPRSALRRWLETIGDEPKAETPAGRLDALLGLEWVVVGDDDGVRTFAVQKTTPMAAAASTSALESTQVVAPGVRLRSVVAAIVVAAIVVGLLAVGGGALGVWAWSSSPSPSPSPSPSASGITDSPASEVEGSSGTSTSSGPGSSGSSTGAPSTGHSTSTGNVEPSRNSPRTVRRGPVGRPSSDPKPKPPPEPAGMAFLRIGGAGALKAEITIDGRSRGHAPRLLELPVGRHRVVLRSGAGEVLAERELDLRAAHTRSAPFHWAVPP